LEKNLPVASGIGGGSADAAAAVRALFNVGKTEAEIDRFISLSDSDFKINVMPTLEQVIALGADIPMCLLPGQQRVRGIGEKCEQIELPLLPALLVNPRIAVSTNEVFKALKQKENVPMVNDLPDFDGVCGFADWLTLQRNDLEIYARQICPAIGDVLDYLRTLDGCLLARMSGSGATCFAIFGTPQIAQSNAKAIQRDHKGWWLAGGGLGTWIERSAPVFS
jgi:4-diphosphocytidyl-2-C-methyl-D-erythritol kinase